MIDVDALPTLACGRCLFFQENASTAGQGGECHFNPPAVVVVQSAVVTRAGSTSHIQTVFTPVPINTWCSKFTDKAQYLAGVQAGIDKETKAE